MCIKLHDWQSWQNQIGFLMAYKVIILEFEMSRKYCKT